MKSKSFNSHRLENNPCERKALNYFYKKNPGGTTTFREMLLKDLLHFDCVSEKAFISNDARVFSKSMDDKDKRKVVEQALDTVIQWIGSPVGLFILKDMLNEIEVVGAKNG